MREDQKHVFVSGKGRTPKYIQAVKDLEYLVRYYGDEAALRAFAEATWADRKKTWARRYGLKHSSGHPCIARLLGQQCQRFMVGTHNVPPCNPPGADHSDLWLKNGRPVVYTTQPYGLLNDTLHELVEFCDRWGLEIMIDTWPGEHFPGWVLWVEITPEDRPLWKLLEEERGERRTGMIGKGMGKV